jgi:DNA-directed RNA polymerase specialized sigma24 family protein
MEAALTPETFAQLLLSLDKDRERAGEKYEDLRRTLLRFFEWRGAPFPEEHADEVFNRVARKLGEGVEIKNLGGYCYEVARLIFLETTKGVERRREPLEALKSEPAAPHDAGLETEEKERRLSCLEECLRALPADGAELIVEYYRYEGRGQIERRRALAVRLGLRRDALANRAQRLRDRLERCVNGCLRKESAI